VTEFRAAVTVRTAIDTLVGRQPSAPGPLVDVRSLRSTAPDVSSAKDALEKAAKLLAPDSPARGAIERGLESIDNATPAGRANQAAAVLRFIESAIELTSEHKTRRGLAKALVETQIKPLIQHFKRSEDNLLTRGEAQRFEAEYGLRAVADMLGPREPAALIIVNALARSQAARGGEVCQDIIAAAIGDVSRILKGREI
jgi:hypothetical protein